MLACLRFYALVSGDNEENKIQSRSARKHVLYEAFVPGNVYKPDPYIAQREFRETEVYSDAALFLFREAVSIRTGKRFNESGFSVIDVAGSTDNDIHP